MTNQPCRDCGHLLEPNARGCPRCAMNVEAERMIEKVIVGVLVAVAVIFFVGVVYLFLR